MNEISAAAERFGPFHSQERIDAARKRLSAFRMLPARDKRKAMNVAYAGIAVDDLDIPQLIRQDERTLADAYLTLTSPPTLDAADSEGWWWRGNIVVYVNSISGKWQWLESWHDESGNYCTRWHPARGGLWQKAVGPFGEMKQEAGT